MDIQDIINKYGVQQTDAGDYKVYTVTVRFDGVAKETIRAKDSADAERIASKNVKERCSGVSGNANVSIKNVHAVLK